MDVHTAVVERAIHLVLFVTGAVAVAIIALAILERAVDRTATRTIRPWHVMLPIALFVASGIAERLYHALL